MDKNQAEKIIGGEIVYFIDQFGFNQYVNVGVMDCMPVDNTCWINLINAADHRYIRSHYVKPTHINQFHTESVWHLLPKNWTYNTKLFEIEDRTPEEQISMLKATRIDNPDEILTCLNKGYLVLARDVYHGNIEEEIDHGMWRIKKSYPHWTQMYGKPDPVMRTADIKNVFFSYQEASDRLDEIKAARKAEMEMLEEEWSKKQIEKILKRFSKDEASKYRQYLYSLPNIEDIEVRKRNGELWMRYFSKHEEFYPVNVNELRRE